jgi:hypothetical protein
MENKRTIRGAGRPVKEKGKRDKMILIRLSDIELEQLLLLEDETGSNRSNLFRVMVLNNSDRVFLNARELLKKLNVISGEMGRIGNNINQLARHTNTLNKNSNVPIGVVTNFNDLMTEYLLVEQELHKAFRDIYRLMSK